MNPSESKANLIFDYHTIRLLIGVIALSFPWVVSILASRITPSISWSYHTDARDIFVGFLFIIGAFLVSYKGHKPTLHKNDVSNFWNWVSKFWKGAINFRIWERKHEEDLVSCVGGVAAWVTAVCPTAFCVEKTCPPDPISTIHYIGATVLFSTTVYFCLVAFKSRAKEKRKAEGLLEKGGNDPKNLRIKFYSFCGWGIAVIMLGSVVVVRTGFDAISNIIFWSETAALELFGIGWLIASQYLPVFTDEVERQKLF
jgi:hypothetical protein